MTDSSRAGAEGERTAERLLIYAGWEVVERQPLVHGHRLDLRVKHVAHGEALVEVKVWETKSGRDTVLKAVAVAYDLHTCGEETPIILILSEDLAGIYGDTVRRALKAAVFTQVLILTLKELP
jgi:hypothetical protein